MTTWLKPPYYTPDTVIYVNCGAFAPRVPTAETMMQETAREILGWPGGFVWGGAALTPEELAAQLLILANSFTDSPFARLIAPDFNPDARAKFYTDLIITKLKEIPAAPFKWTETGSVYDVWTRAKAGV